MMVRYALSPYRLAPNAAEQEIGNHVLTEAEERAHFGLWAISKSPILLGTDLTKIAASSLAVIKNKVKRIRKHMTWPS